MPNIVKLSIAFIVAVLLPCAAEAKVRAVSSFTIIGDLVDKVGGSAIEKSVIVGPDRDPHAYEPKPDDVKKVATADVVFANGLAFDSWVTRLHQASGSEAKVIELASAIKSGLRQASDGEDHREYDPHVWQNLRHAEALVNMIADNLCELDNQNCNLFKKNAAAYVQDLRAVDREIAALISGVPAERRIVITSHDAFGYFADAYGVQFLAPEGINTDAEASARDIAVLIKQIHKVGAAALFTETITDPRLLEQIANETGLSISGALYSDALSGSNGPAANYVDMMRHNARLLAKAMREAKFSAN